MSIADYDAWALFVAVAESGSFAAAARAHGRSVPTVSRAIARLEQRLGGHLFHRNSRRLSLSALGAEALPDARELVAAGQSLEERVGARGEAAGHIRLAAPHEFGQRFLAPLLPAFLAAHPGVTIDLALDDARIDVVAAGVDIVLRIGQLADSRLIARRLCDVGFQVVAAPAGIAAFGRPRHPSDLGRLPCLVYSNSANAHVWRFSHRDGTQIAVRIDGPLTANSGVSLLPALTAGLGIAVCPQFLLGDMVETGAVEPLLPDWTVPATALHMITPPGTLRPLRVRQLMDYLVGRLAPGQSDASR